MPKQPKGPKQQFAPSTLRRHRLAEITELFGVVMVQKCSTCTKHKRVCKVHVATGKCSACYFKNQRCDIRVTQSEFTRLAAEKEKLQRQIKESREAQDAALKAHEQALEDLRVARSREERLRQQMDLIDRRADDAIAVEAREIEELERAEETETMTFGEVPENGFNLHLSPSTWGAFEGYPLEFWETSFDNAPVASGSS
jgi:galactokinase